LLIVAQRRRTTAGLTRCSVRHPPIASNFYP
jgi:hypothetical protein